jgi:hypothetical protein
MQNLRPLIPYGYKLLNKITLSDKQVDAYNSVQKRINNYIEAGLDVPDHLLNGSHNVLNSILITHH